MWNLKKTKTKKPHKLTDTENALVVARGRAGEWWGGRLAEGGLSMAGAAKEKCELGHRE